MSNTVNAIVNNFADRLWEITELLGPVVDGAGAIFQTAVRETANMGLVCVLSGIVALTLAIACLYAIIRTTKKVENKEMRDAVYGITIPGAILFTAIGLVTIFANIINLTAPTKQVVLEVLKHI